MTTVYAGITIAELRASPTRILKRAKDQAHAITILSHNKPAGYLLSPQLMEAILDAVADRIAETRAQSRLATLNTARMVTYAGLAE